VQAASVIYNIGPLKVKFPEIVETYDKFKSPENLETYNKFKFPEILETYVKCKSPEIVTVMKVRIVERLRYVVRIDGERTGNKLLQSKPVGRTEKKEDLD
jgi:hypothetical protein